MTDAALFSALLRLTQSHQTGLKALMRSAELDPAHDLIDLDCTQVDWQGQDLSDCHFKNCDFRGLQHPESLDLTGAIIDTPYLDARIMQAKGYEAALTERSKQALNRVRLYQVARPSWASDFGQDPYGTWADLVIRGVTQRLRWIPPGSFWMGSPEDEKGRDNDEGPQQFITFEKGFWFFDTAVSQELWQAVMIQNPSAFKGKNLPVEYVSWHEVQKFIQQVNDHHPELNLSLPSESAWEYACRAGSITAFEPRVAKTYQGQSITPEEVNYNGNYPYGEAEKGLYRGKTVPVKEAGFQANTWSLWHMHGNVREWCADAWKSSLADIPQNGEPRHSAESSQPGRVVRGGSWSNSAGSVRSASRGRNEPGNRGNNLGFRCALGHGSSSQGQV